MSVARTRGVNGTTWCEQAPALMNGSCATSDSAAARSYCLEMLKLKDGHTRQLVGEYDDELVRVDGEWLFSHRRYQVAMTL